MSAFTNDQLAALRAPLAREHVREREQAGRKLSYIEGWVVIAEANRIFGFDAWDRETIECHCITERETKIGQQQADGWRVGYIARVRITVRPTNQTDPQWWVRREGTGYGSGIDRDPGAAHESAIKEAETDAMKRALMTFGNPFGLALYDKAQTEVAPMPGRQPLQRPPATRPQTNGATRTASAPPPPAPRAVNLAALPAHPEESAGATEARHRVKMLIDKYAHIIAHAPHDRALRVSLPILFDNGNGTADPALFAQVRSEFAEIEAAGEKGRHAADELRRRAAEKMATFTTETV